MPRSEIEDGMGFAGLVPTRAEKRAEEWEAALFKSLRTRISQLEAENARLRDMLGMQPKHVTVGAPHET
jgi:cell shape-determining protein MreC